MARAGPEVGGIHGRLYVLRPVRSDAIRLGRGIGGPRNVVMTQAEFDRLRRIVSDGGVARARPVETGLSDERKVEILAGLKPGEPVIVGPFRTLDELKNGDPVQAVTTPSEIAPAR